MHPKAPPPRIRIREFASPMEVELFIAASCGTDDVGLANSNQRHYDDEDWAVDLVHAVLRGAAKAARTGSNL